MTENDVERCLAELMRREAAARGLEVDVPTDLPLPFGLPGYDEP